MSAGHRARSRLTICVYRSPSILSNRWASRSTSMGSCSYAVLMASLSQEDMLGSARISLRVICAKILWLILSRSRSYAQIASPPRKAALTMANRSEKAIRAVQTQVFAAKSPKGHKVANFPQACLKNRGKLPARAYRKWDFLISFLKIRTIFVIEEVIRVPYNQGV